MMMRKTLGILFATITTFCWSFVAVDAWSLSSSTFVPRHASLQVGHACSSSNSLLCMKIYDWKRRTADESLINNVELTEWTFTNLKSAPGSRKRPTRKGRGISAGQGASCGFGMRGQASRKGRPSRPGFEGGQTPLYRRLPKFVGRPTGPGHEKTIYNILPLDSLNAASPGSTVNFQTMLEQKWTTKSKYDLHKVVVGRKEFNAANLVVQAHAFTQSARQAIEAQGGTCQLLSPTTNKVLEAAAAVEGGEQD